jgi:hypothetical protein
MFILQLRADDLPEDQEKRNHMLIQAEDFAEAYRIGGEVATLLNDDPDVRDHWVFSVIEPFYPLSLSTPVAFVNVLKSNGRV